MGKAFTFTGCIAGELLDRYSYEGLPLTKAQKYELTEGDARIISERLSGKPVCFEHMWGKNKKGKDWTPVGKVLRAWIEPGLKKRLMCEFEIFAPDQNPTLLQKLAVASLAAQDTDNHLARAINELSLRHRWESKEPLEVSLTKGGARSECVIEASQSNHNNNQDLPHLWEILASAEDYDAEEIKTEEVNDDGSNDVPKDVIASAAPLSDDMAFSSAPGMFSGLDDLQRESMSQLPPHVVQRIQSNLIEPISMIPPPQSPAGPTQNQAHEKVQAQLAATDQVLSTPTEDQKMAVDEAEENKEPPPEDPEKRKIWAMEKIQSNPNLSDMEKLAMIKSISESAEKAEMMEEKMKDQEHQMEELKEGLRRGFNVNVPPPQQQQSRHPDGRFAGPPPVMPPRDPVTKRFVSSAPPPQQQLVVTASEDQQHSSFSANQLQSIVAQTIAATIQALDSNKKKQQQEVKAQKEQQYKAEMDAIINKTKRKATHVPVREREEVQMDSQRQQQQDQVVASGNIYEDDLSGGHFNSLPRTAEFEVVAAADDYNSEDYADAGYREEMTAECRAIMNHPLNKLIVRSLKNRQGVADPLPYYAKDATSWRQHRGDRHMPLLVHTHKDDMRNSGVVNEMREMFPNDVIFQ
jgi:hypothetical protein